MKNRIFLLCVFCVLLFWTLTGCAANTDTQAPLTESDVTFIELPQKVLEISVTKNTRFQDAPRWTIRNAKAIEDLCDILQGAALSEGKAIVDSSFTLVLTGEAASKEVLFSAAEDGAQYMIQDEDDTCSSTYQLSASDYDRLKEALAEQGCDTEHLFLPQSLLEYSLNDVRTICQLELGEDIEPVLAAEELLNAFMKSMKEASPSRLFTVTDWSEWNIRLWEGGNVYAPDEGDDVIYKNHANHLSDNEWLLKATTDFTYEGECPLVDGSLNSSGLDMAILRRDGIWWTLIPVGAQEVQ